MLGAFQTKLSSLILKTMKSRVTMMILYKPRYFAPNFFMLSCVKATFTYFTFTLSNLMQGLPSENKKGTRFYSECLYLPTVQGELTRLFLIIKNAQHQ